MTLSADTIEEIYLSLEKWVSSIQYAPIVDLMAASGDSPWRILVATMLSSRTKDEVTAEAVRRLFNEVSDPLSLLATEEETIRNLIYPVGFFKTKAVNLKKLAARIVEDYDSTVPDDLDALVSLPGVGIKTATLVYIKAFGRDEICVDTHVHRIMNIWGVVSTKKPEETRIELKKVLPKKYWKATNQYLVTLGQKICRPMKRECCKCPVGKFCPAFSCSEK